MQKAEDHTEASGYCATPGEDGLHVDASIDHSRLAYASSYGARTFSTLHAGTAAEQMDEKMAAWRARKEKRKQGKLCGFAISGRAATAPTYNDEGEPVDASPHQSVSTSSSIASTYGGASIDSQDAGTASEQMEAKMAAWRARKEKKKKGGFAASGRAATEPTYNRGLQIASRLYEGLTPLRYNSHQMLQDSGTEHGVSFRSANPEWEVHDDEVPKRRLWTVE